MIVTLVIGKKSLDFDITCYEPRLPAITTGSPDNWEPGCPAEVEYEFLGSEAEKDLFLAMVDKFDLYDRIEGLLIDKIEKGEDL